MNVILEWIKLRRQTYDECLLPPPLDNRLVRFLDIMLLKLYIYSLQTMIGHVLLHVAFNCTTAWFSINSTKQLDKI